MLVASAPLGAQLVWSRWHRGPVALQLGPALAPPASPGGFWSSTGHCCRHSPSPSHCTACSALRGLVHSGERLWQSSRQAEGRRWQLAGRLPPETGLFLPPCCCTSPAEGVGGREGSRGCPGAATWGETVLGDGIPLSPFCWWLRLQCFSSPRPRGRARDSSPPHRTNAVIAILQRNSSLKKKKGLFIF